MVFVTNFTPCIGCDNSKCKPNLIYNKDNVHMRCPDIKITIGTWFCSLLIIRDWSYSGMYINIVHYYQFYYMILCNHQWKTKMIQYLFYQKGFRAYRQIVWGYSLAHSHNHQIWINTPGMSVVDSTVVCAHEILRQYDNCNLILSTCFL